MATRAAVRRGPRRKMVWARSVNVQTTVPIAGAQANALADFESQYGANLIGATVTRVRGVIVARPATLAQVDSLRFAARVSSQAAVTAGNGPQDMPYEDWSMWESFVSNPGGTLPPLYEGHQRIVDVRSQRKVEEINEQFTFWIQPRAASWLVSWDLSILLKLP